MNVSLSEPGVAALAGVRFRRFRDPDDFPAMAEVGRLCNLADDVQFVESAADLAETFNHSPDFDRQRDVLVAEAAAGGQMAGYARVTWRTDADGTRLYQPIGFVAPQWRRRGLGRALLRWSEQRLRELTAAQAYSGPRVLSNFCPTSRVGKVILLEQEGYQVVRHFYTMERELARGLPAAALPAGLEIRPVQAEQLHTIYVASTTAFAESWGYAPPSEDAYARWLKMPNFDPRLWQVAWDTATGQVAGVAINEIDAAANAEFGRKVGLVADLSVGRAWRRRGLGRALLALSLAEFAALGLDTATLQVDTENASGAGRLYESAGFRTVGHSLAFRKPLAMAPNGGSPAVEQ